MFGYRNDIVRLSILLLWRLDWVILQMESSLNVHVLGKHVGTCLSEAHLIHKNSIIFVIIPATWNLFPDFFYNLEKKSTDKQVSFDLFHCGNKCKQIRKIPQQLIQCDATH